MNSIIINNENGVITDPKILKHLFNVLKVEVGDNIRVTVLNQGLGQAKILKLTEKFCEVEIASLTKQAHAEVHLIVGLSRPQTLKKVLEHGTTMGVTHFHFYPATLSEKSYATSKIFEQQELDDLLHAGLSQSNLYYQMPQVKIENYNPAAKFGDFTQKYILEFSTSNSFLDSKINFTSPIVLSIGPERGFVKEDIVHFEKAAFEKIKISASTLRVEHAVFTALAQLELISKKF